MTHIYMNQKNIGQYKTSDINIIVSIASGQTILINTTKNLAFFFNPSSFVINHIGKTDDIMTMQFIKLITLILITAFLIAKNGTSMSVYAIF